MTQRCMLDIAKKHNIDNVDEAIDACEFVEELLKEMVVEMQDGHIRTEWVVRAYTDANWVVGDLAEEIEVMQVKAEMLE